MELAFSLDSTAVLGVGSMITFNSTIKTFRDLCTNGSKGEYDSWSDFANWSPLACHH